VNLRDHFRVNLGDHFKVDGRGQICVNFPLLLLVHNSPYIALV